jgi:hypothetical protein
LFCNFLVELVVIAARAGAGMPFCELIFCIFDIVLFPVCGLGLVFLWNGVDTLMGVWGDFNYIFWENIIGVGFFGGYCLRFGVCADRNSGVQWHKASRAWLAALRASLGRL